MLSVGTILRNQRKNKKLTLDDVEKRIRIRKRYLSALERGEWGEFESKIYITGLIKNYAKFLDLDEENMIAYFRRDYEQKEETKFKERTHDSYFRPRTRFFILGIVSFILIIFASYFGYQTYLFLTPPTVKILKPVERIFRARDKITIVGQTSPDSTIRIFDTRVFQNEEGIFTYDLPLQEGLNTIRIEVIGANGKQTVLTEEFIKE